MMVVKLVVLFYLIWATISETAPAVKDKDGIMQLVQNWPPSVCNVSRCWATDYEERFTIHGLWPHECPGEPFDMEKIRKVDSLVSNLEKNWTALEMKTNENLWKHEWNKHGTCTGFGLIDYFNVTLEEYGKYNLTAALARENITAGTNSTVQNISNAIKAVTHVRPTVVCKKDNGGRQVLLEVYVCYKYNNTAMVLRNCPEESKGCNSGDVELVKKPSQTGNEPVTKDELCNLDKPVEFVQKVPQTGNELVTKDELCNIPDADKPVEFVQNVPQTGNEPVMKDEL